MVDKSLRFVPGARFTSKYWLTIIPVLFFYVYLATVVVKLDVLVDLVKSPVTTNRLGAISIVVGLSLAFVAAVLPQISHSRMSQSMWGHMIRRFQSNRMAVTGTVLFLIFLFASLMAPLIAPFDPAAQSDPVSQQYRAPSQQHPMGTDKFGRDVLSRVLYGAQVSLAVGIGAVVLSSLIGLGVGAFSGYSGGWIDEVAMRLVDGLLAFPRLLLVLTILAFFANSFWIVIVLLALTGWMGASRLVRSEVLSLKEQEFVHAAVASGIGRSRIILRHLVPNTLGIVIVSATLRIGTMILLESYLSFLGLGVQPPRASWGGMVFEGRDVLLSAWWVSAFPGLAIVAAVVACNLFGDGLRDSMDTRAG